MRLLQYYMSFSSPDDDSSIFRSLKIGITEKDHGYNDIIIRLSKKYNYIKESLELVNNINDLLSKSIDNKDIRYRLCIDEDVHISVLKLNVTVRKPLIHLNHTVNDDLTKLKNRLEEDIRKSGLQNT